MNPASSVMSSYELMKEKRQPFSDRYSSLGITNIETNQEIDPLKLLKDIAKSVIPLWRINNSSEELDRPISVTSYKEGAYYIMESESLAIYAHGKTEQESIDDFVSQVIYFHEFYNNVSENKLTVNALKLKKIYKKLFVR